MSVVYNGQSISNILCTDRYTITRQWTATDACGNTRTATQRITVQDTQAPLFTSVPANVTVQCNNIPGAGTATATDNCDTDVSVAYNGETRTNGSCPDSYTLTRRWTATDHRSGAVLLNPLHAPGPTHPVQPSPYTPSSRRFANPLALRLEDIAAYRRADPATRARTLDVMERLVALTADLGGTLLVIAIDGDGEDLSYEGLGFDRSHTAWVGHVMSAAPGRRADHLQNLFAISIGASVSALDLRNALFASAAANAAGELEASFSLEDGSDGAAPAAADYALALGELAGLEDISIVAAPGASAYADAQAINNLLISHAESRRAYRIAVLDLPPDQLPGQARTLRGLIDSRYAAVYYPWVVVSNPLARPAPLNAPSNPSRT
mgnify:CR=1 FL=1